MTVKYGFFIWLLHDYKEPYGTLFFDYVPKVGKRMDIGGELWRVRTVDEDRLEVVVEAAKEKK